MTTQTIWRGKCGHCGMEWRDSKDHGEVGAAFVADCWRCFLPVLWSRWEVAEVTRWQGVVKRRLRRAK